MSLPRESDARKAGLALPPYLGVRKLLARFVTSAVLRSVSHERPRSLVRPGVSLLPTINFIAGLPNLALSLLPAAQGASAKRVKLTEKNGEPVEVNTRIKKPGAYTLYVTASPRWSGSGPGANPYEQPIQIGSFRIPDELFLNQGRGQPSCNKVRFGPLGAHARVRVAAAAAAAAAAARAVAGGVLLLCAHFAGRLGMAGLFARPRSKLKLWAELRATTSSHRLH